jgi:hypothetical protein
VKKELIVFLVVLLILTFVQHTDILSTPIERIIALPTSGAYGLGAVHPLVFTLAGYILLWIGRMVVKGTIKVFGK